MDLQRTAIGGTTAVLLVIVIVLAGSLGVILAAPRSITQPEATTSTATATTGSATLQPCSIYVWNASVPSSTPALQNEPVLLVRPGSTGYVCVTYQTAWQGNPVLFSSDSSYSSSPFLTNGTYAFYPFIVANYHGCGEPSASCSQVIYHSFKVEAHPSAVRPLGIMDYVTVVYSLTTPSNSTGFYDQSAPWTGCLGMPMAVGYSASQVNASDFTREPIVECPIQLFIPVAEYVTGMNVTYINGLQS